MKKTVIPFVLLGIVLLLGLVDVGLNVLSFIPGIGPALESLSEGVLEVAQGVLASLAVYYRGKR